MINYPEYFPASAACCPKIWINLLQIVQIFGEIFFGLNVFAINHYLRRNRCGSSGIFFIFTIKVGGIAIVVLHHASSLKSFKCFCNIISIINTRFINIMIYSYLDRPWPSWLLVDLSLTTSSLPRPSWRSSRGSWPTDNLSAGWFHWPRASRSSQNTCLGRDCVSRSFSNHSELFWSKESVHWKYDKIREMLETVVDSEHMKSVGGEWGPTLLVWENR